MLRPMPPKTWAIFTLSCSGLFALLSCTTGATPVCGPDAGCGPPFDGPPPDSGEVDAADGSADSSSEATPDAPDAPGDAPADSPHDAPEDSHDGSG
jgi:hypothetical protein